METDTTRTLLERWNRGDSSALDELLRRDLDWIRTHVRTRLGEGLRRRAETDDFVQEAVVEMLRYGPRFVVESRAHFRSLISRIVENVLRGRHDWFHRQRRAISKERPLSADTILSLGGPVANTPTPSQDASKREDEAWLRLALELLGDTDRELLVAREWQRRSFSEIADELGVGEDTARMRFNRALGRLAKKAKQLHRGELDDALASPS